MSDIPSIVKVGPYRYRVRTDKDAVAEARGDSYQGFHSAPRLMLAIDPDYPRDKVAETLVHEALHAVWMVVNLPREKLEGVTAETVVGALAPTLLGVLRDNPALVSYLTEWSDPE